jgi:hypothetical protein
MHALVGVVRNPGAGSALLARLEKAERDLVLAQRSAVRAGNEDRSWRCFHCGALFTSYGAAEEHFGKTPEGTSVCVPQLRQRLADLQETYNKVFVRLEAAEATARGLAVAVCAANRERDEARGSLARAGQSRERLAEYAHSAWSGWMKYLFGKCISRDGEVVIPRWAVERWQRQSSTAYADLPESEKASDRTEADKMLSIALAPEPGQAAHDVRDPDSPCSSFVAGSPSGDCQGDGHYRCRECESREPGSWSETDNADWTPTEEPPHIFAPAPGQAPEGGAK